MSWNRNHAAARPLGALFQGGSLTALSDGQLLERFATRDRDVGEAAFAALVARHGPMVWRTCRAVLRDDHDAADAFQAALLVLVRRAGSLWVDESIGPWLHRVAFRTAVHARRDRDRRREAERRAAEQARERTFEVVPDDLAPTIHQEIERLPDRHRIPLILCDLEGRSYEEAARHLGCPVGTVRSRLARGRARLQERLRRRGIGLAEAQPVLLAGGESTVAPPPSLFESMGRVAASLAVDPLKSPRGFSASSVVLAEGVLKTMRMSRLLKAGASTLAMVAGLSSAAWLAHAAQGVAPPPAQAARGVEPADAPPAVDLRGNWIVRGYPSGQGIALIRIEGRPPSARATLLSISNPEFLFFAESAVETFQLDGEAVRLTLKLAAKRPIDSKVMDVVAYLPRNQANPRVLLGSMGHGRPGQFPARLERTDAKELDPKEPLTPGGDDLRKYNQTKDPVKQIEILEGMLKTYGDEPMALVAGWVLPITLADVKAPAGEVRAAIDRTIKLATRYGREMEVGAINTIVRNLVGNEAIKDLTLEYARKAAAKLRPSDRRALQEEALKNLASALRKSETADGPELKAVEARLAALGVPAAAQTQDTALAAQWAMAFASAWKAALGVPAAAQTQAAARTANWAKTFAAARKEAAGAGKLIMVDFSTEWCSWCKRLDAEVFPKPAVVEALRQFVPVKVDAEDGEGRPLAKQYQAHIQGYPTILFIDPAPGHEEDGRIVGKIASFLPPTAFADQLNTIAELPRDLAPLRERLKDHPDDGASARTLATSLAMQGELDEAVKLAEPARGREPDPDGDRWASVDNTIGGEFLFRGNPARAAEWFARASRAAKRPIDSYLARLGAFLAAAMQGKPETAVKELEAAVGVVGIPDDDRAFARSFLQGLKAGQPVPISTPK